jgi:desulfoferrodoxin (superoxide reductase-like protein)
MNNTSKVFKEEINVSASNKFLTVKDAAVELKLKVGQIKHLITQELIDSKLENGTRLVDVNSVDELVMIDLKKGENIYPRRQDYKLKSNKTIDKKIVINSIIRYVNNFVGEEAEKSRKDFGKLFGIDTANKDIPNVQILVHNMIHNHHDKNIILVNRCDKYTIYYFNNKSENLFYFFDTKEFKN